MRSMCVFGLLLAAVATSPSGCGLVEEEGSLLGLLGVVGEHAYFEHYEEWSGFDTLPSTIWQVDLATGGTKNLAAAAVRYDTQIADDYYVAERPTKDGQGSQVVATRISTGEETVVLERDVQLGGRYDRVFALAGDHVVALTDGGVLVYDLATSQVERTIAVQGALVELLAASREWALVTRNMVYTGDQVLVNLNTEAVLAVPALPDDHYGLYFDAAFADEYMFTASYSLDASGRVSGSAIQALHIPTLTWATLADYGEWNGGPLSSPVLTVHGADETTVLAEYIEPFRQARIDAINRSSGQRQEIVRSTGLNVGPWCACLSAGRAYWLNDDLVTYDIATGEQRTTPVNVPD